MWFEINCSNNSISFLALNLTTPCLQLVVILLGPSIWSIDISGMKTGVLTKGDRSLNLFLVLSGELRNNLSGLLAVDGLPLFGIGSRSTTGCWLRGSADRERVCGFCWIEPRRCCAFTAAFLTTWNMRMWLSFFEKVRHVHTSVYIIDNNCPYLWKLIKI